MESFDKNDMLEYVKTFKNENDTSTYYIKYFNPDGSIKCEGVKSNNEKEGKWKYYKNHKLIAVEKFNKGLLTDTQTFYFSDGKLDRFKILDQPIPCFCDTQLHYSFKQVAFWRNGKLREINHIKNCEFDGRTQLYDSVTGKLTTEFYEIEGLKNGPYKGISMDTILIGNYEEGEPVGIWKTFKAGKLIHEEEYSKN